MKKALEISVVIGVFVLGWAIGRGNPQIIKTTALRENNPAYKFINPILLCNINTASQSYSEDTSLSQSLVSFTKKYPNDDISAYYLNLNSGAWASAYEDEQYSPASMLKVPTMVEVLKYAETNPDILQKKIYYDGSFNDNAAEYFKPLKTVQAGQSYTVDDLLAYTIEYSDNNAVRLLHDNLDPNIFTNLYKDLRIEIPSDTIDFMTVRTYSLFLRVLYNSTYLDRELSEKALELLAYRDFPPGLQAGVPDSVPVADKFGERTIYKPDGTIENRELHDCGIVYPANNNPYIICVMTRGQDFNELASAISGIS